jgi:hypothetical protein
VRFAFLIAASLVLAGCGITQRGTTVTTIVLTGPAAVVGAGSSTIYQSTAGWAVVQRGAKAVALHKVRGTWRPDRTGAVRIDILGPHGVAARQPQVAAQFTAKSNLVETGLWVDGVDLLVKGGGTLMNGTIYGTTAKPLRRGRHVAVAYGRTATSAAAVAWAFRVR